MVYTTTVQSFFSIGDLPDSPLPTYALLSGNNLIMLPLDKSALNQASLVGNAIPGCNAVRWYNASLPGFVSATKNFLGNWVGNFNTEIGDPLMVYTTTVQTWPGAKLSK
jgi:hypothetical protein